MKYYNLTACHRLSGISMQLVRRGLRHRCARAHPIPIMGQTCLMHYSEGPDPKFLIFSAK